MMDAAATDASSTVPTGTTPSATAQEDNALYPEEEITEGNWNTPKVEIVDVKVTTGEEQEKIFWIQRSKLYRWKDSEWKQRGVGEAKLLEHTTTGKIRFLLRQEKTLKIMANHYVIQTDIYCKLTPNVGSEKIWVWAVMDYAEETVQNEQFALKFGTVEQATLFKTKFDEAAKINEKLFNLPATSKVVEPASDKTKVDVTASQENTQKEDAPSSSPEKVESSDKSA